MIACIQSWIAIALDGGLVALCVFVWLASRRVRRHADEVQRHADRAVRIARDAELFADLQVRRKPG